MSLFHQKTSEKIMMGYFWRSVCNLFRFWQVLQLSICIYFSVNYFYQTNQNVFGMIKFLIGVSFFFFFHLNMEDHALSYICLFGCKLKIVSLGITEQRHEKTCFMPYANNKGADQPAHPCSLISIFVDCCLDSIMPLVSMFEISSLQLTSVAEQTDLSLTWSHSRRHVFLWRSSTVRHHLAKVVM